MWMIFGAGAIVLAAVNILFAFSGKETKWVRFCSMALTALTVCVFYQDAAHRVMNEDWAGLMDILPSVSNLLWICVIASIVINGVSLFGKGRNQ
ncbi:MAG: hypothetical protein LIO42_06560 [Oscillospiraceae bacterium]|nr:hypothetical protein [Oscillospiraceae bacterium]